MSDQNQPLDYYEILGVTTNATHEQIRRAFLNSATKWHRDRNQETDSKRMVRLIMAAWEILGDSEKRADYDRRLTDDDLDFDRRLIWFRNSLLSRLLENDVDLYEILDVTHDATSGNINVAYHLQQEFIDQDQELRQNPTERDRVRKLVMDARFVLTDSKLRSEYDQRYFLPHSKVAEAIHSAQQEELLQQDELLKHDRQAQAENRHEEEQRDRNPQELSENQLESEISKGTYRFVWAVILVIVITGAALFARLVWVSEQDPISRPSWDARERNQRVSELQATARKSLTEIPKLRATISTLPSEQEMLSRIAEIDSAITPLPANNRSDAARDRFADQIASSILANVDATSVASWRNRGTRVAGTATAVAKDLKLYESSVDHFERESAVRRDFWIYVAAVVGVAILIIAVAVARNRQMRGLREARAHGSQTRKKIQSDAGRESRERQVQERHEQRERERLAREKIQGDDAGRESRERQVREQHEQRERERLKREELERADAEREARERRVRELHERREREKVRRDRT